MWWNSSRTASVCSAVLALILATSRLTFCTSSSLSCCSSCALLASPSATSNMAAFRRLGSASASLVVFRIMAGTPLSRESVEHAVPWFQQVDAQIQVHQLRQFLQTTPLANELVLRQLLSYHMQKPGKSTSDRDKTDFLMVQYFSLCAPSGLEDEDLDLDYVAQVLEPVLGPQQPKLPAWLKPLDTIMQAAAGCEPLSELLYSGALEKGRKLKTENAARYFEPAAMVAFARFSFLMRRIFFRLMHDDLNAIQDGLRELERRGVSTVDCRRAQFSADEPVARLRMICQSWKVMFHAEYSSGQPLRMLVDLRAAIDDALQNERSEER